MLKRSFLFAVCAACIANTPSLAAPVSVSELQDLPPSNFTVVNAGSAIAPNNWAYKTLESISKKYGLLVGKPNEKFNANQPLTKKEAAVLLVSLVGKIEQDKVQLSDVEKDRIEILKQELGDEIQALTGRVANLETSVNGLQGSVSKLEQADSQTVKVGTGKDFKLTGTIQGRYTGNFRKGYDNTAPNFAIPVAELGFNGKLNKFVNVVANFQPGRYYNNPKIPTMMGDLYAATNVVPHHTFYAGQSRVPIGYEGAASTLVTDAVVKSQIARNFNDRRDIGLKIAGNWKYADYYVSAMNGTKYLSADDKSDMDIASWVNFKPLAAHPEFGKLVLGGGYAVGRAALSPNVFTLGGTTPTTTYNTVAYNNFGGYAEYKIWKNTTKFEYGRQNGYLTRNTDAQGFYVTDLFDVTKKFQLLAKVDRFDPNTKIDNNSITELTGGINYFMLNNNIKFQLDFVQVIDQAHRDSQRIVAQTQYNF